MRSLRFTAITLCLLIVCTVFGYGQSDRGTIRGTVTDPNGAIVPNVKVTLTGTETGETREQTTGSEGIYSFAELRPTTYSVTAEAAGFQRTTIEEFKVAVQVTHTLDIKLQVGAVTNEVTINAEAEALQADTPVRQTNVTERQVKELPLLTGNETSGRSPLSFIFLDSNVGAGQTNGQTNSSRFRVSGGQAGGTEILVDGASVRRTQNGTFFSEVGPSPNAFQEFTISTSTFSAEYGNSSGGIVNFNLKSGTNEFHGEVYEFLRNEVLNANTLVNNANGIKRNRDNRNNYGFNIGGPIYIPGFGEGGPVVHKLKDRAFFFFNYEGFRNRLGANTITTVPTARMRTGDFGELLTDPYVLQFFNGPVRIYDPRQPQATRSAIPGNRLDLVNTVINGRALIDPAGRAIMGFYPLPNRTGPNGSTVYQNYVGTGLNPDTTNQYLIKTDFNLTEAQRLSVSYFRRKNSRIAGPIPVLPLPFTSQDSWSQAFSTHTSRIQYDYNIAPTLLNHLNIGYTFFDVANMNTTEGFDNSSLGIPRNSTQNIAFPRIGFPGYGGNDPRNTQNIGSTFFTDRIRDGALEFSDFLTFIAGRQSIRFGGTVRFAQFNVRQFIDPGGSFNFRNNQTASDADPEGGFPLASLITGATEFAFNSNVSIEPAFRQVTQGYFFQDDIKVTSNLTLNLGVRYDLPGLRYESRDRFRTFDPNVINPAIGRAGALVGAGGQGGFGTEVRTLAKQDKTNIGPRVGAAYALDSKTVIRGGIGLYYAPVLYGTDGGGDINTGTIGYNTTGNVFRPTGPGDRTATTFLSSFPSIPAVDPANQYVGNTGVGILTFGDTFRTGRTLQYSLDVQRELPYRFVASIGYIGSRADRLRSNFGRPNALPLNTLRLGYSILNKPFNNLTAGERAYASSIGVNIPANANAIYTGFDGGCDDPTRCSVAQALRPFPQYGRINNISESLGEADYNALQAKIERRFSNGIQFGAAYTFSKLLTNAADTVFGSTPQEGVIQNPFDISALKTLSPTNSPHVFVTNFLIELPFGKGKGFIDKGGLINALVGGFQVGGILRYQVGTPIVLSFPAESNFLDLAGYYGSLRPNLTGQPLTLENRVAVPGNAPGQFYVLNPAAFAAPPDFSAGPSFTANPAAYAAYYADPNRFFGTAPVVINAVHSDPFFIEDISLLKKTRITETVTIEVGAEFFNVFNRVLNAPPNVNLGRPNADRTFARTGGGTTGNSNFGVVGVGNEPRRIQLRARLIF
jgi:hypothetical protein